MQVIILDTANAVFRGEGYLINFCPFCGQALDWRKVEE